jgi:8-amino-7-oxononanoate synthase
MPPTVPEGTQRVRLCLHAGNSKQDVNALVARIRRWLIERRIIKFEEQNVQSTELKARL